MADNDHLTKVHIDLPNHWATGGEVLWAKPLGVDLFEIDSVPFYAYGINCGDTVRATADSAELMPEVREVVKRGGHETLRVFFMNHLPRDQQIEILASLEPYGASPERATPHYVAIDIAPTGDIRNVRQRLEEFVTAGLLEYETCEERVPGSFDEAPQTTEAS